MTKIVHHLITHEPILVAPHRAARPHAFGNDTSGQDECPFCRGHEAMTPPEVLRIERDGEWVVRVFPNKYPAAPRHEVIVEAPDHDMAFDRIVDATAVVEAWVARYRAVAAEPGIEYVSLFKNHGPAAGASIPHLHSQLLGIPFIPPRIQREGEAFAAAGECPLCAAIETHGRDGLMIGENESFVWLAPSASQLANEQWIVPKRHQNAMETLTGGEMRDLGALLQASAAAMQKIAPSYNCLFMNFPSVPSAHFYVDAFPRRTTIAGFELETGTYIEVIEPADTARELRT
jgi:UDPglucose--hexose-1-phosphate uridylyltransferase